MTRTRILAIVAALALSVVTYGAAHADPEPSVSDRLVRATEAQTRAVEAQTRAIERLTRAVERAAR